MSSRARAPKRRPGCKTGSPNWVRCEMAYLSTSAIESSMRYLSSAYSSICQLITAPEPSVEGRVIHAIKLGKGSGPNRRGMLALGGVHARELVNPDMLVTLAL